MSSPDLNHRRRPVFITCDHAVLSFRKRRATVPDHIARLILAAHGDRGHFNSVFTVWHVLVHDLARHEGQAPFRTLSCLRSRSDRHPGSRTNSHKIHAALNDRFAKMCTRLGSQAVAHLTRIASWPYDCAVGGDF